MMPLVAFLQHCYFSIFYTLYYLSAKVQLIETIYTILINISTMTYTLVFTVVLTVHNIYQLFGGDMIYEKMFKFKSL